MSKSPNIFLPAIGVTGIVLGAAYGFSTRTYKAEEAEVAQRAAAAAESRAAELAAEITAVQDAARAEVAEWAARPAARSLTEPAPKPDGTFGLGRAALAGEIAAWDVDVLPDGRGLPEGSGDVWTGDEVFSEQCASCHGDFAEGVGNWPVLAGGFDTLGDEDPVKTVGSYWPYLSTVWDYVHRSMPFGAAQTLTADETYAIVAYILYSNDLVDDDFELSHENFTDVEMHNTDGFVIDDRAEREYVIWSTEPCMEHCKDAVEITKRASMVNVTPLDDFMHPAMRGEMPGEMGHTLTSPEDAPALEEANAGDAALIAAGETTFNRQCKTCHMVGEGAKNRTGPHLNAVLGRVAGGADGFRYSGTMKGAGENGMVWDSDALSGFLADPKGYLDGTKMNFRGLQSDEDVQAVIAYLASLSK